RLLFSALGANVLAKDGALTGAFATMPEVEGPDECEPFVMRLPSGLTIEPTERNIELRIARRVPGERVTLLWSRVPGRLATPAVQGYLADWVPMAVVNAAGRIGAGTSLDNTLRMAGHGDTEWLLLALQPHA